MGKRFIRDESGMTMALTMIMIVLISVMGAGLLAFVQNDLNSVIEVNKGQKALDIAEAGVQAAKSHLRVDSFREHYDTARTNDCNVGPRVGGDNWSKATDIYTDPNGYCTGPSTRAANQIGVTKNFGGGKFQVTIECFTQPIGGDPSASGTCSGGAGNAPVATPADQAKFFKIISTGYDTTSGDGAKRKIEAIYTTAKRTYAPIAYWTPRSIMFTGGGSTTVEKMSFFAGGNISGVEATRAGTTIANRTAPAIYQDWNVPPYNTTGRVNSSGTPITGAGFGAVNCVYAHKIDDNTCLANPGTNTLVADSYNDYDSHTGSLAQLRRITFVGSAPNPTPADQITFPFEEGSAIADPRSVVDPGLVEEMRSAAADQGNYHQATGTFPIDTADWPPTSGEIIYFVDGADVDFRVRRVPQAAGIIVVRDGNFSFSSSSTGFKGVIIVIGNGNLQAGQCNSTAGKGYFEMKGSGQLDGYVTASGCMTINGNVSPSLSIIEISNLNTFYDVKLWSWRELYQ